VANWGPDDAIRLAAVRAAYLALLLGLVGGLGLATAVLSEAADRPTTVAAALGLRSDAALDDRRSVAVAVLTAACMRRLGLDWAHTVEPAPTIPNADLDPIAWADRWGFGISTAVAQPSVPPDTDPNLAAVAAMPVAAQSVYRAALHGATGRSGCHETANATVYGLRDRLLAPLRPSLDALEAEIASDPGALRALGSWHDCVAGVSAGATIDRRSLPGALVQRFIGRMSAPIDSGDLPALQAEERRVAGVLARCEVGYADAKATAAARHETMFVARHREVLRTIGDAIRAAEAALPTLPP
jgi:hypothetical protein